MPGQGHDMGEHLTLPHVAIGQDASSGVRNFQTLSTLKGLKNDRKKQQANAIPEATHGPRPRQTCNLAARQREP